MKKDRTCEYCNVLFMQEEGRVFSNHVRWCKKNITNGDKGVASSIASCKKTLNARILSKKGELEEFNVACKKCKKFFVVNEWNKLHPQKKNYFCSRNCANSRGQRTEDFKQKIKSKSKEKSDKKVRVSTECPICGDMIIHVRSKIKNTCSRICALRNRMTAEQGSLRSTAEQGSLKDYRYLCSFKFSLNEYPEAFDFSLAEKYGWYKAKNRGDNLGGVSRDHIVSVRFGYDKGIDTKIMSHPANCQLLRHNDNVSKSKKCDLTIEELIVKISEWDDRYKNEGN